MITRNNLPISFAAYSKLTICSNLLIDGGFLLSIDDVLPLVIGKGEKPQVWLQALINNEKKEFLPLVEASISKHPAVSIIENQGMLTIMIQDTNILTIEKYDIESAEINFINLNTIGFNICGDANKLTIGNSTYSGNTMSGAGVLIGFNA